MNFTKVNIDYHDVIKNNLVDYNLHDLYLENLYISGSFAMNILQEQAVSKSDLDLYLNIYNLSKFKIEEIVTKFILAGYRPKKSKFELLKDDDVKIKNKYSLKSTVIRNLTNKILRASKMCDTSREYSYFSLAKHIITIIRLYNTDIDKEIDIIVLKPSKSNTIQKLLLDTFDYDIVKNYIECKNSRYNMYSHNLDNIKNKKAVMSINHFKDRVLNNIHEFNNFITRYVKYKTIKKFTIYIDKMHISEALFKNLVDIYLKNMLFFYNNFIENKRNYQVSEISLNPKKASLIKLFQIKVQSINIEDGNFIMLTTNRYDYNLRNYIIESYLADDFTNLNIGKLIFSHYTKIAMTLLINKNHEIYSTEIEDMICQYFESSLKINRNNNECEVCLDQKKLYDIHCGNGHKLCGMCIKRISNKCPFCRSAIFSG